MTYGFKWEDVSITDAIKPQVLERCKTYSLQTPISTINKYWGQEMLIENCSDGSVIKRIDMHAGKQSSLEYHVTKRETYYLLYGELEIGLRIGRAENRSLLLFAGESFSIQPGLMHMRIALTDLTIIEWASSNDFSDSHLVQDGTRYRHVNGPADA